MLKNLEAKIGCKVLLGAAQIKQRIIEKKDGFSILEKGLILLLAIALIAAAKIKFFSANDKIGNVLDTTIDGLYK